MGSRHGHGKEESKNSKPEEVLRLENLIAKHGGRTHGWEVRDHEHFIATLRRYKLHPQEELDWSLPPDRLPKLEDALEELAFRLPAIREREGEQPGTGLQIVREHFKWYCRYLMWSSQLKAEVTRWRRRRDEEAAVRSGDAEW